MMKKLHFLKALSMAIFFVAAGLLHASDLVQKEIVLEEGTWVKKNSQHPGGDECLSGLSLEPQDGDIQNLVVMFHGYKSSSEPLIEVVEQWLSLLPKTAFVAPNGLEKCRKAGCYRWFSLPRRLPNVVQEGAKKIRGKISDYIMSQAKNYNVPLSRVALVGVSQGAMVALHQGVYGLEECAGVLGYAGGFLKDESLEVINTPRTFLWHGAADKKVPSLFSVMGQQALESLGCDSQILITPGVGHEISEEGFKAGGAFLQEVLQ